MGEVYQPPHILTRGTVLREALACAERGIPVFPCKPGGKEPLTHHGFKDASTDPSKIHAWWNAHPLANIGVPTGERSGLLVVDVDHPAGLDALEAEHGELPATRTHATGSGGMHYLYRYPAGSNISISAGKLAHGLDTRGEGGYVIVPPSATTGPYTVLDDLPPAAPPEWLLEALRKPHNANGKMASGRGGAGTPHRPGSVGVGPGEPIPQGQRNWSLYRYGCALRGRGFAHAAILEELEGANERLCKPPLDAIEVEKIATSASRHEPGNASPGADPEALESLGSIEEANLWNRSWKGQGWKTPRSVMVALITEARKHGKKTRTGVRVSISVRNLALAASVSKQALTRRNGALDKLRDAGLIRSVKGSGTKSGALVLLSPRASLTHSSTGEARPSSGSTLRAPLTTERLRYNKPVYEAVDGVSWRVGTVLRLGKSAENIVDVLERAGEMDFAALGTELGIKRPRDLRRRVLPRLEAAGVVECSGDVVRLRTDWLVALNRKRHEDQELDDHERDRKKYSEESRIYALKVEARKLDRVGMTPDEIARELKIGTEDARRLLEIARPVADLVVVDSADGNIEELERVEYPVEDFEGIEMKAPPSPLAVALRDYLERFPRDAHESPYWLANTLWAYELYPGKPTSHELRDALEELGLWQGHLKAVA